MLSICVASLLFGCGSGNDSSDNITEANTNGVSVEQNNTESTISNIQEQEGREGKVSINGIAVDDLIVNGVVKVYSATTPRILLAEGRTDPETGAYTLNIDYDGVVVLDVTGDEQSLMKNPETGETQPCEGDLLLQSAAILTPEMEALEVNISPLTDLVVSQMEERGGSAADLEAAQDNIGQIFGFDPLGDSPIENESYSHTVGAIRDLADQKGVTMVEIIDQINQDTVDGKSGDDGAIAHELAQMMDQHGIVNTFTENDGVVDPQENIPNEEDSVDTTTTTASTVVITPRVSSATDIQAAKTFFDDLRTQTMSVIDYDETGNAGFLDTESEALGTKLENMALNIDLVADYSIGIVGLVTEAIDEGVDSKTIEMEDESEDECADGCPEAVPAEKMMQKGGDPLVSRTLSVVKTADPKVWTYNMEENTSVTYTGTVHLPDSNLSSITASNFTSLIAQFEGTLPLRYMDSPELAGEQNVTLDLEVTKSAMGADLELKELSIVNGTDSIGVKTLKGSVEYDHDADTDEVTMKSVKLDTITLTATVEGYELEGKLDITDYTTNTNIATKGFESGTTVYQTQVGGNIRCTGEHNEWISSENMGGEVIYTDQSDVEHAIPVQTWGDFYQRFDGNLQNLAEGEEINEYIDDPEMGGSEHTTYLGLSFDTISLSSDSCSNIIVEDFNIHAYLDGDTNRTDVDAHIFCLNSAGERSEISDATGTFTDATGVAHALENPSEGELHSLSGWEGNTEGLELNSAHVWFDIQGGDTFDRLAISEVNSECANPTLNYVDISVNTEDHGEGEEPYTYVHYDIVCEDGSAPTQSTVIYTDKANVAHTLVVDSSIMSPNPADSNIISGNVEELVLDRGDVNYHAKGEVLETPSMFRVTGSSCPNPTFEGYGISLDLEENSDIYNSGVLPKKAKFIGSIKNTVTSGEINGELNVEWKNAEDINLTDDSDKAQLDVTLQGKIKMPSRPEMILNLGYENQEDTNDYSLSYQYDTTVLNASGSLVEDQNGTIEFTGTNGIKLVVTFENGDPVYGASSPVTRNGRKIGELQERADVPVISYVDGSFESLP